MLVTALAAQDRALEAWSELRPELDLQTIEDSVFGALPLVYRRLEAAGLDDPDLPRLKGIYRSAWARNTILTERLGEIVESAQRAEVPLLLMGSIGAAHRYYGGFGLRPTGFLEFLVRDRDLTRAVRALGDAGWSTHGGARREAGGPVGLRDTRDNVCLLRTNLAPDFVPRAQWLPDAPFWDSATDVEWSGAVVPALCATDDLLATIVTGARVTPTRSLQWLIDTAAIVRSSHAVDWDRLCRLAGERQQVLRLRRAFDYLRDELGVAVPADVRQRLAGQNPTARERLTYSLTTRDIHRLGSLPQALGEHLAVTTGRSPWETASSFPKFLRARWGVASARQLPAEAGRRALRNLRGERNQGQPLNR